MDTEINSKLLEKKFYKLVTNICNKYFKKNKKKLDALVEKYINQHIPYQQPNSHFINDKENTYIYILIDCNNNNLCKVGIHTGSKKKLINKYITAIPNIEIKLFKMINNPKIMEDEIKSCFEDYRVKNANGKLSEWYNINYKIIERYIQENSSIEELDEE